MNAKSIEDIPSSVYHLQINEKFTLKNAIDLIPYLYDLGFEGIYCSPLFEAISPHGYDVIDPNKLNHLIGTMEDYNAFCALLQEHRMKQVLDVIPNHMSIKGKNNHWWVNVLEYGQASSFSEFFDIDWHPQKKQLKEKILLPVLKDVYGIALENQEIQLIWENGFWVRIQDYQFPINPFSYSYIFEAMPGATIPPLKNQGSTDEGDEQKKLLIEHYQRDQNVKLHIENLLKLFNGKKGDDKSFDLLHRLLEKQHYRLAHWLVAGQEINYRRFFNIHDLICIHIEKKRVLEAHHKWIFELIETKKVQGLRIDHPDGLYDPAEYFQCLQNKNPPLIVLEKILDFKEKLPENWSVDGTVGYEFLNLLNGLFIKKKNAMRLTKIYRQFIKQDIVYDTLLYNRKKWFVFHQMGSEIRSLGWQLDQVTENYRKYRDFTYVALTEAINEVVACFPVYRSYIRQGAPISERDVKYISETIEKAKARAPVHIDRLIFDYLKSLLLLKLQLNEESQLEIMNIVLRFQQLTAPVMAKGLEDSVYYIYNRLISLNEVGGSPKNFGFLKAEFDQFNKEKKDKWPFGFLSSSTHDTKQSEDVRARINVLSEIPQKWKARVYEWKKANKKYKKLIKGSLFPDANTEYYLYQMLLGAWPASEEIDNKLLDRLWTSLQKALREAGHHTSHRLPNDEYESCVRDFFYSILSAKSDNKFYASFIEFQKEISYYGSLNSISALVLKIGCPGVVDVYQGNEIFTYCLMDPDNRRAVNYDLCKQEVNSNLKMMVTRKGLNFRRKYKELFLQGDYIPLIVAGQKKENGIAFSRKFGDQIVIVAALRFLTELTDKELWKTISLQLPGTFKEGFYHDVFTGEMISVHYTGEKTMINPFKDRYYVMLTNLEL